MAGADALMALGGSLADLPAAVPSTEVLAGGGPFLLMLGNVLGLDAFLPALGMRPEAAVLASAGFAVVSVVVNLYGGVITEKKRAELQLEVGW